MIPDDEVPNFDILKECLSTAVISKLVPNGGKVKKKVKGRKNEIKPVRQLAVQNGEATNDDADLAEFIEYLTEETFLSLPCQVRLLSYAAVQNDAALATRYGPSLDTATLEALIKPLPLSILDSLVSYGLIKDETDLDRFLEKPLTQYVEAATSAPPEHTPASTSSRPDGCEICSREHIPLTYHHLIPRAVHTKAVKRGWHREWELTKVAWLCRACHLFVHRIATNEELAKEYYDVELLMEREDVQRWAQWAAKVRWKSR